MHIPKLLRLSTFLLVEACGNPSPKTPPVQPTIEQLPLPKQPAPLPEKFDETILTPNSSWITSASFSSLNSINGRLVIRTKDRSYTYLDVPMELWLEFKTADSKGKHYNRYIKGKYKREQ